MYCCCCWYDVECCCWCWCCCWCLSINFFISTRPPLLNWTGIRWLFNSVSGLQTITKKSLWKGEKNNPHTNTGTGTHSHSEGDGERHTQTHLDSTSSRLAMKPSNNDQRNDDSFLKWKTAKIFRAEEERRGGRAGLGWGFLSLKAKKKKWLPPSDAVSRSLNESSNAPIGRLAALRLRLSSLPSLLHLQTHAIQSPISLLLLLLL